MKKRERFDAVGFMRAARDLMSKEISGMTPQQQISYIRRKSASIAGRRLPSASGRSSPGAADGPPGHGSTRPPAASCEPWAVGYHHSTPRFLAPSTPSFA